MNKQDVLAAIDQDRLYLLLQPVVSASTHLPVFYEALLRMRTGGGDVIPAVEFIERAEQQNYIHDVDRRSLELAIETLERHRGFDLAINISSLTTADFAWIRMLDDLTIDRRGLTRRLIVEVTETAAIRDINRTLAFIDALKELGCRIAIDDYGAGHTNFTNLKLFSPHIVKIDRSFVACHDEPGNRAFIEAVLDLSHSLGFETVAEGVENEDCAQALSGMGTTYMQGYYFGEPKLPQAALGPAGDHERS